MSVLSSSCLKKCSAKRSKRLGSNPSDEKQSNNSGNSLDISSRLNSGTSTASGSTWAGRCSCWTVLGRRLGTTTGGRSLRCAGIGVNGMGGLIVRRSSWTRGLLYNLPSTNRLSNSTWWSFYIFACWWKARDKTVNLRFCQAHVFSVVIYPRFWIYSPTVETEVVMFFSESLINPRNFNFYTVLVQYFTFLFFRKTKNNLEIGGHEILI